MVECVFGCVPACVFVFILFIYLFCCWRKDGNFEVCLTPMGVAQSLHSLLIFSIIFSVPLVPFSILRAALQPSFCPLPISPRPNIYSALLPRLSRGGGL